MQKLNRFTIILSLLAILPLITSVSVRGETLPIIAFGDSLTEGCGNMFGGSCWLTCRPGDDCYDYEDKVDELLQSNNYDYDVHNYGSGGEKTADGLNRIDDVLNASCNAGAKYIFILEGTNDLTFNISKNNIKFNLGQMIDKSIEKGLVPLIATIPPDQTPYREYKDIPAMNLLIKDLVSEKTAAGKEVYLVDLYESLEPNWSDYLSPASCYGELNPNDRLHPNSEGVDRIGELWYQGLKEVLPPRAMGWLNILLKNS